jgi:hypothetical protein
MIGFQLIQHQSAVEGGLVAKTDILIFACQIGKNLSDGSALGFSQLEKLTDDF